MSFASAGACTTGTIRNIKSSQRRHAHIKKIRALGPLRRYLIIAKKLTPKGRENQAVQGWNLPRISLILCIFRSAQRRSKLLTNRSEALGSVK